MYSVVVNPRSRRVVKFNLTKVYTGIQRAAARVEKAGRSISTYEFEYVKQYAQALANETDPTLAGLELGYIYAHLSRLDKESAQNQKPAC